MATSDWCILRMLPTYSMVIITTLLCFLPRGLKACEGVDRQCMGCISIFSVIFIKLQVVLIYVVGLGMEVQSSLEKEPKFKFKVISS